MVARGEEKGFCRSGICTVLVRSHEVRAVWPFLNYAHSQNTCSAFPSMKSLLSFCCHWYNLHPHGRMGGEAGTAVLELWCLPGSSEVCVNPVLDNRAGQNLNTKYFS